MINVVVVTVWSLLDPLGVRGALQLLEIIMMMMMMMQMKEHERVFRE